MQTADRGKRNYTPLNAAVLQNSVPSAVGFLPKPESKKPVLYSVLLVLFFCILIGGILMTFLK